MGRTRLLGLSFSGGIGEVGSFFVQSSTSFNRSAESRFDPRSHRVLPPSRTG
jgi:hypothetical protein